MILRCLAYKGEAMRKSVFLIFICFLVSAVNAEIDERIKVVRQLYKDFAWEAIIVSPRNDDVILIDQPREILEKYFDTKLAGLIIKDRECVKNSGGEICNLNFSPIWASQDWAACDLMISLGENPNEVVVKFVYPGDHSKIKIVYKMIKNVSHWRISDIKYSEGYSLVGVLSN